MGTRAAGHARGVSKQLWAIALVALGLAAAAAGRAARAQEAPAAPKADPLAAPKADPAEARRDKDIIMVMQAKADLLKQRIEEDFESAKAYGAKRALFDWSKLTVTEIRKEVYEALRDVVISGKIGGDSQELEELSLRPYVGKHLSWVLNLREPGWYLKTLIIKYNEGGEKKERTYQLGKDTQVWQHSPGNYIISLEPNMVPLGYVAVMEDSKTKTQVKKHPERAWPESNEKFWFIELKGFTRTGKGDLADLLDALQNKKQPVIANPFRDIENAKERTLLVGTLLPSTVKPEVELDQNKLIIRYLGGNQLTGVARVWMLMPLTAERKNSELRKLQEVTKTSALLAGIKENSLQADKSDKLTPDALERPKWIEVPLKGQNYEREIELDDIDGWRKAAADKMYRLVVREFVNVDDMSSIRDVQVEQGGQPVNVPVNDEEIKKWPFAQKDRKKTAGP